MNGHGLVVHLKREPYDVRIDRATKWGNPFAVGKDGTREQVIARYEEWLLLPAQRHLADSLHELRGKVLGCWCAPAGGVTPENQPWVCHGQVLASLANR